MAFKDYEPKIRRKSSNKSIVRAFFSHSKSKTNPYLFIQIAKEALSLLNKDKEDVGFVRLQIDDENPKNIKMIPCEESHPNSRKLAKAGANYLRLVTSWSQDNVWENKGGKMIKDCESSIDYENEAILATLPS